MRPERSGRTGRVMSIRSTASRASSSTSANAALRASSAEATALFSTFSAAPRARRASESSPARSFISPVMRPFLPRSPMRMRSNASRSPAASMRADNSARRLSTSCIGRESAMNFPVSVLYPRSPHPTPLPAGRAREARSAGEGNAYSGHGRAERVAGVPVQRREHLRFLHRQVGQDLAVDLDAGLGESVHEPRVGQAVQAGGGVDPLYPQRPEGALAVAPVTVGVLLRLLDLLDRHAEGGRGAAAIALRLLQHLLVPSLVGDAPFYASHEGVSLAMRKVLFGDHRRVVRQDHRAARLALHLLRPAAQVVALAGAVGADLAGRGEAESLPGRRLVLQLGHFSNLSLSRIAPARAPAATPTGWACPSAGPACEASRKARCIRATPAVGKAARLTSS